MNKSTHHTLFVFAATILLLAATSRQSHCADQTHAQIFFTDPDGAVVEWGKGTSDERTTLPGRQDFALGAAYDLRLSNLSASKTKQASIRLTLAASPGPDGHRFLEHNPIPLTITAEDIDQLSSEKRVTKAIYIPSGEYSDFALAGVQTIVSTRQEPGVDVTAEAKARGTLLCVVELIPVTTSDAASKPLKPDSRPSDAGDGNAAHLERLRHALEDSNPLVAKHAAIALGDAQDKSAVPALRKSLTHTDQRVRDAAADSLEQILKLAE